MQRRRRLLKGMVLLLAVVLIVLVAILLRSCSAGRPLLGTWKIDETTFYDLDGKNRTVLHTSPNDSDRNYYLLHGHHMRNKTMFGKLPKYAEQSYYDEHPIIHFDTLYEQREYQVIADFYSRIYSKKRNGRVPLL